MTLALDLNLSSFRPLLVGSGRVAQHFRSYFAKKNIPFSTWQNARDVQAPDFIALAEQSQFVWILVPDSAILNVARSIVSIAPKVTLVHASAATSVPGVLTIHPLQTFGATLFDLPTYESIPLGFITEEWSEQIELKQLFRSVLKNPMFDVSEKDRSYYHACCVMMANLPQILWSETSSASNEKIHIDPKLFHPILRQSLNNYLESGSQALTGPWVRGDSQTTERNIAALQGSPLQALYLSFFEFYKLTTSSERKSYDHGSRL